MRGRLVHLGFAAVLAAGCDGEASEDDTKEADLRVSPTVVQWALGWELGKAEALADGGWRLETDLGYEVELEGGWVANWGASLVPCTDTQAEREGEAGLDLRSPLASSPTAGFDSPSLAAPGDGLAGHPSEDDLSAAIFDLVEAVGGEHEDPSWVRELEGASYCQTHLLLAPAGQTSAGVEEAGEIVGASVILVGSWRRAGEDASAGQAFEIRSEQAYGALLDFSGVGAEADELRVVLRRRLDTLFDGVDFEALEAEPEAAAWIVLGNLAKHTRVELE